MKCDKRDETSNDVYIPKLNSQIVWVQRVQNNTSKSKHSLWHHCFRDPFCVLRNNQRRDGL